MVSIGIKFRETVTRADLSLCGTELKMAGGWPHLPPRFSGSQTARLPVSVGERPVRLHTVPRPDKESFVAGQSTGGYNYLNEAARSTLWYGRD